MIQVRPAEIDLLEVPFRVPFETAERVWRMRQLAIVRLRTENGITGAGEIALDAPGGLPVPKLAELVDGLRDLDLADLDALDRRLDGLAFGWSSFGRSLKCGIEMAALDALGRTTGRSVGELLSSAVQASVGVNGLIGAEPADEAATAANRLAGEGFRCLKVKVGPELKLGGWLAGGPSGGFRVELKVGGESSPWALKKRVQAVREAVGPDMSLRIDANGTWQSEGLAIERLVSLEPFNVEYVEQPVPVLLGPEALARVRRAVPMAVAADESVVDAEAAKELLLAQAVDVLVVKPSRVGGLREARRIVELASLLGVRTVVSTMFETGIGLTAALHLAATIPGQTAHGLGTASLLESDLLIDGPQVVGGRLAVPAGPGLGVAIDEEMIKRYRLS